MYVGYTAKPRVCLAGRDEELFEESTLQKSKTLVVRLDGGSQKGPGVLSRKGDDA